MENKQTADSRPARFEQGRPSAARFFAGNFENVDRLLILKQGAAVPCFF